MSVKKLLILLLFFSYKASAFTLACPSTTTECEGWDAETLSIQVNTDNCPSTITTEIQEALDLWNGISTSGLKFEIGAANNDTPATIVARVESTFIPHDLVIACDPNFQTTLSFSTAEVNGIPGVANSNTINGNNIDVGYVLLNVQAGANANINNLSAELRKVIIAHEFGHAIGLGHSDTNKALMFFDATAKEKMSLHQDDIDGMSYLYPRSEPGDQVFGCGLVSGGVPPAPPNGSALLLLLPLILLAGLRRRERFSFKNLH